MQPRSPAITYVLAAGLVVIASIGGLHVANTLFQRRSDVRDVQRLIEPAVKKFVPGPVLLGMPTASAQQPQSAPSSASPPQPMTPTEPVVTRSTTPRAKPQAKSTAEPDPGAVIDWLLKDRTR